MKKFISLFTLLGCFLLASCSFLTREDITPPPGIEQSVSQTQKTQTEDETEDNSPAIQVASPTPSQTEPINLTGEIKTTQDISGLIITRMHLFFELTAKDRIQVTQMVMIANPTMEAVGPLEAGLPVLTFPLTPGYTNLQFQDGKLGDRYLLTKDGFGDTSSLPPDKMRQILFTYELPFTDTFTFSQTLKYPVQAMIIVVPETGLRLQSDQLQFEGVQGAQEVSFQVYSGENFPAGHPLKLSITSSPVKLAFSGDSMRNLLIGGGFLLLAIALGSFWIHRYQHPVEKSSSRVGTPDNETGLLDAILMLDDEYQNGKISEQDYLKRRVTLKARLMTLLQEKK
jgi:hypothetical protein